MEILPTRFTSYQLTAEEELRGSVLNLEQKWVLQNQMSAAALEKNALEFDEHSPILFAQQEASLKGQIEAFEYLLNLSDSAELELTRLNTGNDNEELLP